MSSTHKYPKRDINIIIKSIPRLPINAECISSTFALGNVSCILCIKISAKKNINAAAGACGFYISFPKNISNTVAISKRTKVNGLVKSIMNILFPPLFFLKFIILV